jgi:hypothetical protein
MGGGLMQLVAYGAQDVYLTGNPQITLFKVVYRRHTNFSAECAEIPIETAKPGGRVSVQIQRSADLMAKTYHRTSLSALEPTNSSNFNGEVAWVRRLGHALIKNAEVQIGGSAIDKHYGVWLDIWFELTHTSSQRRGYDNLIGDVPELTTLATTIAGGANVYTPFQFWFCRNYGLALPLIALQYHDVRINIEYESMSNLVVYTKGTGSDSAPKFSNYSFGSSGILIDYIYLDSEERRRFAQVGHEYLIEQLQLNEQNLAATTNQQFSLNFNHPCKELIWAHRCGAFNGANGSTFLAYSNGDANSDWKDALQLAAENLARSMVGVTNSFTNGGTITQVTGRGTTDPIFAIAVGSSTFRFTIIDSTSASSNTFDILTNPLTIGSVNLANKLGTVSVDMTFTSTTAFTFSVAVAGHTLTLDDLSVPISKMTDYRLAAAKSGDYSVVQLNNYGLRLDGKGNMVTEGNITLNGHDRFAKQTGNYFNYLEPNAHHTRTPADGINVYSFGLHPEQHQPTGTCNMSRIDTARLVYKVADILAANRSGTFDIYTGTIVYIFVINYNILRMMAGMAGVAYSN